MTKLLLKLFVPDAEQTDNPRVRARIGKLSGGVGIVCNVLLFAGKLIAGMLTGSVAITADAMNNLSDASSSVVTLAGFRLAEKPADEDHPYGHARYEYLAGLAVSAIILLIGFQLAETSVQKLLDPTPTAFTIPAAAVLVVSVFVKLWMCMFNRSLGKKIQSTALTATAADSRNDALSTSAVLFAAIVEALTSWQIDGFVGLLVALFIMYNGVMLAKDTISPLLGEAASPELQQQIVQTVRQSPMVLGYHDLMVHDYGPGQRFASIHVEMDARENPLVCHETIDRLERECYKAHNVHLVIHYDPIAVGDPEVQRLREETLAVLKAADERLTLHDFRVVRGEHSMNLIFDVPLPEDLRGQTAQLRTCVETQMSEKEGVSCAAVITFDSVAFQPTAE